MGMEWDSGIGKRWGRGVGKEGMVGVSDREGKRGDWIKEG